MRICLLGEYSGDLDEGMRIASSYYATLLSKKHQVLTLDLRNVFTRDFWSEIGSFKPEVIHYIHGPTINSFILLKFLSIYCKKSVSIMSAMRPYFTFLSRQFIPFFRPDLILTQSQKSDTLFKGKNCKTEFLPSGVDIEKFGLQTQKTKTELRHRYGIGYEKFVILHIGSIKEGRNIKLLEKLQSGDNQVVIVGAVSPGINENLVHQLENSGCIVWTNYFENIEEIYGFADCYVFPTLDISDASGRSVADSIEMPLTVLEAMACNLPVIATKFSALPRAFEEGNGLFFVEGNESDFINTIEHIKNSNLSIRTREYVIPYSWQSIVNRMEYIYKKTVMNNKSVCILS